MYRIATAYKWPDMIKKSRQIIMSSHAVTKKELDDISLYALEVHDTELYNFWASKQGTLGELLRIPEETREESNGQGQSSILVD